MSQLHITAYVKRQVYDYIVSQENFLGTYGDGSYYDAPDLVDFLKLIWDLPTMLSEDPRYHNAEAEAIQHTRKNDDWSIEQTFLQRFNLLSGDQAYFVKFVEAVVSPEVRESEEEIRNYVIQINSFLKSCSCELRIKDFINEKPIYRLENGVNQISIARDISQNLIPVFVNTHCDALPAFHLACSDWDDFGYKTVFKLKYVETDYNWIDLGCVRILAKGQDDMRDKLPSRFLSLPDTFCSLGASLEYYKKIRSVLGDNYRSFLYAMRDAACFSLICDSFANVNGFRTSLLRYPNSDEALNKARYVLAGFDVSERFDFIFKAQIPYHPDTVLPIRFNFERIDEESNMNRVMAIIGENGVGKTTVLSQLAECIVFNKADRFTPHPPLFTKVIAVSYSIFDKFFNINGTSFNYAYCGVRNPDGALMKEGEINHRRSVSLTMIGETNRTDKLKSYLERLIDADILNTFMDDKGNIDTQRFADNQFRLSSGQTMLMNLIIEILANIRTNSLILLDEPEIHLHPNGITRFVYLIHKICDDFASCCIMATHSSIVIQEMLSRNVIVMDRAEDGAPCVKPMRVESFGENLTTITEDIFGRNEMTPYYWRKIKDIARESENMTEVLMRIQNSDLPISMSAYMLIDKYMHHD
jgi:ABC-type cobalamin/Fe3+-siderophores transport system ATPase subunit